MPLESGTWKPPHLAKACAALFAIAAIGGLVAPSAARADDPKAMFKAMSDYVSGQKAISFKFDANLDVVTTQGQKLGLASSGTMTINRPDKIHATRAGGFADIEFVFDGKTLTLVGRDANAYAQVPAPATIDKLVDELRDKYHRPVPAADLIMSNPYDQLMPLVTDAKDLGSGVIHGVECDHLAFRTRDADWQIWIAQGSRPYPCRYVITSKNVKGSPEYRIDVIDWKTGTDVAADNFAATIPSGAKQLDPKNLPGSDDLPSIFKIKGEK